MKHRNDRDDVTNVTVAKVTSKPQRRGAEDAEHAEKSKRKIDEYVITSKSKCGVETSCASEQNELGDERLFRESG
jgi:hypothetical protein